MIFTSIEIFISIGQYVLLNRIVTDNMSATAGLITDTDSD